MKLNNIKIISLLLYVLFLCGCEGLSEFGNDDVVYKVESSKTSLGDVNVLLSRLREYPVSFFSSVEYDQELAELRFKRGAPNQSVIEYMSQNKGQFSIFAENGSAPAIVNSHILDVEAGHNFSGEYRVIRIALSEEGERLMMSMSKSNIGKTLAVKLDDAILMRPIVNDVLGKRFEVSFDGSSSQALMMSVLIKHGALNDSIVLTKKPKLSY